MCILCTKYRLSGRWQFLELNEIWAHYCKIYAEHGPGQQHGSAVRVAQRFAYYGNNHHTLKPETLDWDFLQWETFVLNHWIAPSLGGEPYTQEYRDAMARQFNNPNTASSKLAFMNRPARGPADRS